MSLRLLVLLPSAAALLGLLVAGRGHLARAVAMAGGLVTLAVAVVLAVRTDPEVVVESRLMPGLRLGVSGLDVGSLSIPFSQVASGPVVLIALVVALVAACIQVYATWYLRDDERYGIFAATVSLFSAAMLLVVTSHDLVLTLVGWEVMGWCSYLLIGHWSRKEDARRAAQKAFLVTKVADVGFLLGVVILAAGAGTTSYVGVSGYWNSADCAAGADCASANHHVLTLALVLLLAGILGKSAMVPFHDWLPDAMEGPTPASALIHAATMVAAGTFVVAQLFDVFVVDDAARLVLGVSTAVTMVWAAILAFGQSDLKRLLAYSTVSQVAIMLSALAAAPPDDHGAAGTLHLYAHALFKALLFLLVGWMSVLGGGTSARRLRGVARHALLLRIGWLIALLSLAGFPFLVGGVSKEHVIEAASSGADAGDPTARLVLVALLVTVPLTAAYATRAYLVVSALRDAPAPGPGPEPGQPAIPGTVQPARVVTEPGGEMPPHAGRDLLVVHDPRVTVDLDAFSPDDPAQSHADGRPPVVVIAVIMVLLAGTLLGGLVVLTDLLPLGASASLGLTVATVGLIVVGAVVAWLASFSHRHQEGRARVDPATRIVASRMPLFDRGFGVDTAYRALVARPVLALARGAAHFDDRAIDATARLCARGVASFGGLGVRAHRRERPSTGLVWVALGALLVGAVGVLGWR